jgi:hypothetical protein
LFTGTPVRHGASNIEEISQIGRIARTREKGGVARQPVEPIGDVTGLRMESLGS